MSSRKAIAAQEVTCVVSTHLQRHAPPMALLHAHSHYEVTFSDRAEYLAVEINRHAVNESAMEAMDSPVYSLLAHW